MEYRIITHLKWEPHSQPSKLTNNPPHTHTHTQIQVLPGSEPPAAPNASSEHLYSMTPSPASATWTTSSPPRIPVSQSDDNQAP